jgi:hypothetical protein
MMATSSLSGEAGDLPANTDLELKVDFAEHQRRWTVLLRIILAVPHIVVVFAISIAAFVVMVIGWFAALVIGRLPDWAAEFLRGYLAWQARLIGYLQLLTDRYPPFAFSATDYPIQAVIPLPGKLNRAAVLFRLILIIPAAILGGLVVFGWYVVSFIIWLIVLVAGRVPATLFLVTSAVLRFQLRYHSYTSMLTSAYPKHLFGDEPARSELATDKPATRPLVLTKTARTLLIVLIVLGVLAYFGPVARHDQPTTFGPVTASGG